MRLWVGIDGVISSTKFEFSVVRRANSSRISAFITKLQKILYEKFSFVLKRKFVVSIQTLCRKKFSISVKFIIFNQQFSYLILCSKENKRSFSSGNEYCNKTITCPIAKSLSGVNTRVLQSIWIKHSNQSQPNYRKQFRFRFIYLSLRIAIRSLKNK